MGNFFLLLSLALAAGCNCQLKHWQCVSGSDDSVPSALSHLSFIDITPADATLALPQSQQYLAMGTYSDGTALDLTSSVTWESSNPTIATVDNSGLMASLAGGTTNITATLDGVVGATDLNITDITLTAIVVTPANPSVQQGLTQQFSAQGNYSDGSNRNLTNLVTWASSNTAGATISSSGLARVVAGGTEQITATYQSVTGATNLRGISTDATLAGLAVDPIGSGFAPPFSPGTLNYSMDADLNSSDVNLTATAAYSAATLQLKIGTGSFSPITSGVPNLITIPVGVTSVQIKVTAETGTTVQTYKVLIVKLGQ